MLIESTAHKLISSLVCNAQNNFIAAGIENPDDGTGVSPVYIWSVISHLTLTPNSDQATGTSATHQRQLAHMWSLTRIPLLLYNCIPLILRYFCHPAPTV